MRKKFVKSSRPTYKKRIKKAQQGMRFASYNVIDTPTIDYKDITNPVNPFSEYNFNTTYDTPQGLVVPARVEDTVEETPVIDNSIAEPVINNTVTSKPVIDKPVTKTANSTWKSPYTNRRQWTTELIDAYKRAGITNDNAIRMLLAQDALESSWGKSAQGKYNFGNLTTGAKWKGDYVTGNDKNAKGEAIKQKFRSYNSMDEYAADKIQFLKRLYDFDENDDINKFVAKLTGSNKGKRRYAEATNYAKVLTGVYNGIPKGENGMIVKYQNPPHGIARRDATYVAPKMYAPRPYKTKEEEIIEQNRNSEMISIPAHSTIGMVDGKLQVIDTPARQITNVGAGYLSGTDPVGEFVVGNVVASKPLIWLGKGIDYSMNKAISKWIKNRAVGKAIKNSEVKVPAKPLSDAKPLSNPYPIIGTADEVAEEYMNVSGTIFGSPIAKRSEQAVFNHATDPTKVVKIYAHNNKGFRNMNELKAFMPTFAKRNKIPFAVKNEPIGYVRGKDGIFPVYVQDKVTPLKAMDNATYERKILPELVKQLKAKGYTQTSPDVFSNGKFKITDLFPDNMGYDGNGNLVFFDAKVYRLGGLLGTRHK